MKRKNVLLSLIVLSSLLLLAACSSKEDGAESKEIKIGINQLAEHPALDQVNQGFVDGLKDLGVDASIDFKNAQGSIPNTISISQKFVDNKSDLIFAIGTTAAQSTSQVAGDIPVLFSAVTDPVEAGLVKSFDQPNSTIIGTSDESPIKEQLSLFKDLDPSIKNVGIIYNTGEPNSQVQVDRAKEIGKEIGINIETIGITKISDMPQAVDSILSKVDGIYTITDNMVASAINVIGKKASEKGIVTIGAEESHVKGGILMTYGISYYELGKQTARMAKDILVDKKDIKSLACEKSDKFSKVFNKDTLDNLGLDLNHPVFQGGSQID